MLIVAPGARGAGDDRERLGEADQQRVAQRDDLAVRPAVPRGGRRATARAPISAIISATSAGRAEDGLGPLVEQQPGDGARHRGEREVEQEPRVGVGERTARERGRAGRPATSRSQSRQKAKATAASVPRWSATSNASPLSGQPISHGTTIRWPELLIGRNSPSALQDPEHDARAARSCGLPRVDAARARVLASLRLRVCPRPGAPAI